MAYRPILSLILLSIAAFQLISVSALDNAFVADYKRKLLQRKQLQTTSLNLSKSRNSTNVDVGNVEEPNATKRPVVDLDGNLIPDYDVIYTFDQLVDHKDPKKGTFKQRYFHTWEYYKPGKSRSASHPRCRLPLARWTHLPLHTRGDHDYYYLYVPRTLREMPCEC